MKRFAALLLCAAPLLASAQIYRWVDANGQVHFSQNPPSSGPYKDVTPASSSIAPSPGRAKIAVGDSGDRQTLKVKADHAERCAKARERISFLEEKTARRLFKTDNDGQPAPLTQEEFDQQLNDARAAGSKYCG
jgi:hypothetical protein